MPIVDNWVDIYSDLRAWAATDAIHKMGWLRAGDNIHLTEQHTEDGELWFRFDLSNGVDLNPLGGGYNEYWVKGDELEVAATSSIPTPVPTPVPTPEPTPGDQPSDAQIGAVVRFLFGKSDPHIMG